MGQEIIAWGADLAALGIGGREDMAPGGEGSQTRH